MIEAISRQPSEMFELQNNRQRLAVNSEFAAAFRGATQGAAAVSPPQKSVETAASALSPGTALPQVAETPAPVSTATKPEAAQNDCTSFPPGWSGPPGQAGSSYNPIAAWDQVPGQQPSWVSGNYPGATWSSVSQAGFLMPYSDLSPGPGEDTFSNANANVINQGWSKYYDQVDGTQLGNQIVWGTNNPTHEVPAPWMASSNPNPPFIPQYTASNSSDPSQPTQPNYVPPSQMPT